MSYLVLARKYRPSLFDEVIGQEHITGLLKGAVTSGRIAQAYLFCGPRGIGKTSCARILAKSLNCKDAPTVHPCGQCPACREIAQGNSFDVIEIDGASNRGIDEIRTIRENVKFVPTYGKYKIYIVDEVHMLTTEAFNALLKTLEEPPPHVKFIFATTDPNKLPATIISRCQRFDYKRIPFKVAVQALQAIAKKEKIDIDQDALYAIAKAAQGSFRDSLSILDQISAISGEGVKGRDVFEMLGLVETGLLFKLSDALGKKDCLTAFKVFEEIIAQGKDVRQLGKDLIEHYRNLMVVNIGGKSVGTMLDCPIPVKDDYLGQSKMLSLRDILRVIDILLEAQEAARITETFRTSLEIAFAKITWVGKEESSYSAASAAVLEQRSAPKRPEKKKSAGHPLSGKILDNNKGQANALQASDVLRPKPEFEIGMQGLDLETIKNGWGALTYAVSRQKMSLATYLQEGVPCDFDGYHLTIAFAEGLEFHKESLETKDAAVAVETIFQEQLKHKVVLKYKIVPGTASHHEEDDPGVKATLKAFGGKIISKWHNE